MKTHVYGLALLAAMASACGTVAQAPPQAPNSGENSAAAKSDDAGLRRLDPDKEIWIDSQRKLVVIGGHICLRQGALEMFACPQGTKEHESIVALNCKAWQVHAALLALGAKPIHPVKFDPKYEPAAGTQVDVLVLWTDAEGKRHQVRAQQWIKNHQTGKPLEHPWIFGGSKFWQDPGTGEQLYLAEDGDLICVSNFTTATLDLPIKSSADAAGLLYTAYTERIPPLKTRVRVVLRPVLEQKDADGSGQAEKEQQEPKQPTPKPGAESGAEKKQ